MFSEHPRADLHPTPPGETVFAAERQFSRLNLGFELTYSLDETYAIEALDPCDAEIEALSVKIGQITEFSQALGHGLAISGSPREESYRVHSGKPRMIHENHLKPEDVERKMVAPRADDNTSLADYHRALLENLRRYPDNSEKHAAEILKWRLLLQINSYLDAGMCWWDAGYLQFRIHDDDLVQGNFSSAYCCLETN